MPKKGLTYHRLKVMRNQRNELLDILIRLTTEGNTISIQTAREELARINERIQEDR